MEDKEKYGADERLAGDVDILKVKEERPEQYYVTKYGRFGPIMARLFANGVEARGVERVPEDQRETRRTWNKCVL